MSTRTLCLYRWPFFIIAQSRILHLRQLHTKELKPIKFTFSQGLVLLSIRISRFQKYIHCYVVFTNNRCILPPHTNYPHILFMIPFLYESILPWILWCQCTSWCMQQFELNLMFNLRHLTHPGCSSMVALLKMSIKKHMSLTLFSSLLTASRVFLFASHWVRTRRTLREWFRTWRETKLWLLDLHIAFPTST